MHVHVYVYIHIHPRDLILGPLLRQELWLQACSFRGPNTQVLLYGSKVRNCGACRVSILGILKMVLDRYLGT